MPEYNALIFSVRKRLIVKVCAFVVFALMFGCGKTDSPESNLANADSPTPKSKASPMPLKSEDSERRVLQRVANSRQPVNYTYEWVTEGGKIPIRRVHFDEPAPLADAEQIARELVPESERGKLLNKKIGDIGYPGATGRQEVYEHYEIVYRIKNNRVLAIHLSLR